MKHYGTFNLVFGYIGTESEESKLIGKTEYQW